ncbi:chord-domain-containing protein [Hesseltinella vesiculosa]|uniref:Chord-domain-containing protein n=1 Tax=Hesseltinella vesiculosa TaxID=101127 RepID=A0A1X2GR10_9FUNG|nr:chord-domain-containing protein [Hesseltinella vesiculosa]
MIKCTHQGCGKEYDPTGSEENECQYHSGAPVFHEGLKGWSCCQKRVIDFDDFLKLPGCTYGKHTDEKPASKPVEKKEQVKEATSVKDGVEVYGAPVTHSPLESHTPVETKKQVEPEVEEEDDEAIPVAVGTTCKRRGCGVTYKDDATNRNEGPEAACQYHPGAPVFHEGSKGWSCCPRKVLEFEEFLKISGCKQGKHLFVGQKSDKEEQVDCRMDWYQTQMSVIVSIFAKNKEDTKVTFAERGFDVDIKMKDQKRYTKHFPLFHSIDVEASSFTVLTTKVEVTLKKTSGVSWASLEPNDDVKTWTTFGITGGVGTVGAKEMQYTSDSPLHLK